MGNILKYIAIFISLVFLVGCGPKEMTKTLEGNLTENESVKVIVKYKEKSDVVDKQEIKTSYKNMSDIKKQRLKDDFEKHKNSFNYEGVEVKWEEEGSNVTISINYDYTKVDFSKIVAGKALKEDILAEDKKSVSLSKLESFFKKLGIEEKK